MSFTLYLYLHVNRIDFMSYPIPTFTLPPLLYMTDLSKICTVSDKRCHYIAANFAKCWPISKLFHRQT